ncbi:MAG: hypothetical protein WCJ97_09835 [Phycisphaerae bacterium]
MTRNLNPAIYAARLEYTDEQRWSITKKWLLRQQAIANRHNGNRPLSRRGAIRAYRWIKRYPYYWITWDRLGSFGQTNPYPALRNKIQGDLAATFLKYGIDYDPVHKFIQEFTSNTTCDMFMDDARRRSINNVKDIWVEFLQTGDRTLFDSSFAKTLLTPGYHTSFPLSRPTIALHITEQVFRYSDNALRPRTYPHTTEEPDPYVLHGRKVCEYYKDSERLFEKLLYAMAYEQSRPSTSSTPAVPAAPVSPAVAPAEDEPKTPPRRPKNWEYKAFYFRATDGMKIAMIATHTEIEKSQGRVSVAIQDVIKYMRYHGAKIDLPKRDKPRILHVPPELLAEIANTTGKTSGLNA